tara:strand:- start:317 stop:451 length:135 start_codon:yes stop_codon:yes gene_type:complete
METKEELALEFKITQEQIKDSQGKAKEELIKERNKIVEEYKKLK